MSRDVQLPSLDVAATVVAVEDGGTGVNKLTQAAASVGVIPLSEKNVANGVASLDANSKVSLSVLPTQLDVDWVNVTGVFVLNVGNNYTFTITDFDSFKNYTVTCSNGTMTRVDAIISYTANSVLGNHTFTVNGRVFSFVIQSPTPQTPTITSPTANAVVQTTSYIFTSSAFVQIGDSSTHLNSDWQIATDAGFTNVVFSTTADAVNKVSWTVPGLSNNASYFVRVRHRATNNNASAYSPTIAFSISSPIPVTPTITSPADGSANMVTNPSFSSSAFVALPDSSTHISSDWQIATDAGFTNVVFSATDSTTYKTSYNVSGLSVNTQYFARVRYKSSNGNKSAYSSTINFTTVGNLVLNLNITSDQSSYNTNDAAVANGWDGIRPINLTITVASGVFVSDFLHSLSGPAGSTVALINNGYLYGSGGVGGLGGTAYIHTNGYLVRYAGPGGNGGDGLTAYSAITVTNNGVIAGGGGGGGGGGPNVVTQIANPPTQYFLGDQIGGDGGGGQGYTPGTNRNLFNSGSQAIASVNNAGAGLGGRAASDAYASSDAGANGGNGGALASSGVAGSTVDGAVPGGAAGSPGRAVSGNAYITWNATGTRIGAIT